VLIQQNVNGSNEFNRSWAEYKVGFNDSRGNYWLGNDLLHQLTQDGRYKLRADMQSRWLSTNYSVYYAEYSSFVVLSEADNYRMQVSGYSGNAGDALSYQNGRMFTTYDRDNDRWINNLFNDNCAVMTGGGFWYNDRGCAYAGVNAVRRVEFLWYNVRLMSVRMWLMCR